MNRRREFLRNIALAIAASLLPKILQPIASEIEEEYFVDESRAVSWRWESKYTFHGLVYFDQHGNRISPSH